MQYLLPFILAMIVTMAWLPVLVRYAAKFGVVDRPGARKVHSAAIPRVGGLAMTFGVMVAALLTIKLQTPDRWFLVAAATLVVFGAIDDRFDLDYRIKFCGQLLAVCIVVIGGDVQIHTVTLDDRVLLPAWLSMPLTIVFLVGVTNAVNLADGLDGLAGGTTFLCLCAVALLSSVGEAGPLIGLALAFAGAVMGFLRFNTYPASVFMGDAGSQLLGFAIGVLSVRATQSAGSQISAAIPVLLLALPILDTLSVIAQRIGEGRSPFSADRNHIHHKLLALGFDHHEAVMVIYLMQALLFVTAYFMRFESDLVIAGTVSAFFVSSIAVFQAAARTGWRVRARGMTATAVVPVPRLIAVIQRPRLAPRLSHVAIAVGFAAYAAAIIGRIPALEGDFRVLVLALLATCVAFTAMLRTAPLHIIEKSALYVTVTILVYIDAVALPEEHGLSLLAWAAVGITAVGTAVRLRLLDDRRFQLTPLDLIVLFMALVVPSLPGTLRLPHGGALAIAKLVILFYAMEMLVSRTDGRALWLRLAGLGVLGALALCPILGN